MALHDLSLLTQPPARTFYLDTSAVMKLMAPALNRKQDIDQGTKLRKFIGRIASAKGRVITSVLSLEEVAANGRNSVRTSSVSQTRYENWRELKLNDKTAAAAIDVTARQKMLTVVGHARQALASVGATIEQPPVKPGDEKNAGTAAYAAWHTLLKTHDDLDAMDALHLVFGNMLSANDFISFDKGWDIATIELYRC